MRIYFFCPTDCSLFRNECASLNIVSYFSSARDIRKKMNQHYPKCCAIFYNVKTYAYAEDGKHFILLAYDKVTNEIFKESTYSCKYKTNYI